MLSRACHHFRDTAIDHVLQCAPLQCLGIVDKQVYKLYKKRYWQTPSVAQDFIRAWREAYQVLRCDSRHSVLDRRKAARDGYPKLFCRMLYVIQCVLYAGICRSCAFTCLEGRRNPSLLRPCCKAKAVAVAASAIGVLHIAFLLHVAFVCCALHVECSAAVGDEMPAFVQFGVLVHPYPVGCRLPFRCKSGALHLVSTHPMRTWVCSCRTLRHWVVLRLTL